jgi:hypothetical protein
MGTLLTQIDRQQSLKVAKDAPVLEKMCRVTLAKDAKVPYELTWCKGLGHKKTLMIIQPGASVMLPLAQAENHFGPFNRFAEYTQALEDNDERWADALRERISTESARYLLRYDYPRGNGKGYHPDMGPVGPHRSPDMKMTVIDGDGTEGEPIRLFQVYGIGEFDDLKDTFRVQETEEQIKARFDASLREKDAEVAAMRRELAQVAGMVQGALLVKPTEAPAKVKHTVKA